MRVEYFEDTDTLQITFNERRVADTKDLDESTLVETDAEGRISGTKAAEIAGMPRLEFLDELARRKLDVIKVDLDELREEIGAA